MIKKKSIKLQQNGVVLYLFKLTGKELIENTEITHYNPSKPEDGYQRPPFPTHYRKISKYLMEDNAILPPAIISAIETDLIDFINDEITVNGKIRVVDGQHRIEGIKHLKFFSDKKFEEILMYEFPVILMGIGSQDKIHEVATFIHLNKRGKKVSTDLAITLAGVLRNQRQEKKHLTYEEVLESITTNISNTLESKGDNITTRINGSFEFTRNNIWYKSISVGDEISRSKPVSINLFNKSLVPLITNFLRFHDINKKTVIPEELPEGEWVESLTKLINDAWSVVVNKWPKCFGIAPRLGYSQKFNIQKGIGVNSLHILLAESIIKGDYDFDQTLLEFKMLIDNSELTETAWRTGGRLSVYNSKSGFEKIAKLIKNEQEISEEDELLF